ncbi:MAG: exonuclease SbcCD subunit D [Dehalococcoidia bacterium]|nr:exonuclease SbcCD subunit D [Dehalococcoidia bacterium]
MLTVINVLHFSDFHIGVETYGKTDADTGLNTRTLDLLKTLDSLVDYSIAEKIDLVVFSGDAYKVRDPTQTHQREFARRMVRLADAGIPVFLLVGNHDLPHAISRATAMDIFNVLRPADGESGKSAYHSNIYIGARPGTTLIQTKNGPVQIVAMPWIRRGSFTNLDEAKGLSVDGVTRMIEGKLTDILVSEAANLDKTIPSVMSAHVTISTAKYGTERGMMMGRDHVLMQSTVTSLGFDYVALGHIHKRQQLSSNPPVIYPGSLQRLDFGDEDEESKGFYTFKLDPRMPHGQMCVSFDYHPLESRQFLTFEIDISEQDTDPTATVLNAISRKRITNAIVRMRISLPQSRAPLLNDATIMKALQPAHFVASMVKDVQRTNRSRLGSASIEGVTPLEGIRLYLEAKKTPKDREKIVMRYAEQLMNEINNKGDE